MEWYKTIDTHLHTNGYEPTDADLCLYIKYHQGLISFISLYIDNCTIITHHSQVRSIKDMIHQRFPIKDLGNATSILRLEILHNHQHGLLYICQHGKIDAILLSFSLENLQACQHAHAEHHRAH
jgi:hypothetical protein